MRFEEWEPIYLEILAEMGYDRARDEESARFLSGLLRGMDPSRLASRQALEALITGNDVLICGNAPILEAELAQINPEEYCIIAADGAAGVLMRAAIVPDLIVTDLDGDIEAEIAASQKGAVVVVHAHGDNIPVIRQVVPRLTHIIGSTQAAPLVSVQNFGGFTDGDRCVFLACEFRPASITLVGFDFEDTDVTDAKKQKLEWARKLIDMALRTYCC